MSSTMLDSTPCTRLKKRMTETHTHLDVEQLVHNFVSEKGVQNFSVFNVN